MVLTYLKRMSLFTSTLVSHECPGKMESQKQSLRLTISVVEQLQLITYTDWISVGSQREGKYGKLELCDTAAAAMQGTMKPEHGIQPFKNI